MAKPYFSLLQKIQDVTGFSDSELALLINKSRACVYKYRTGALPEYLDGRQTENLKAAWRLYLAQLQQGVDELEMLS